MTNTRQSRVFGSRGQRRHTIIIASGDRVRHVTVGNWALMGCGAILTLALGGYLAITAYFLMHDDLVDLNAERQTKMQQDYENRIAALRMEVDRVTSRQLLDQQQIEDKVERLLAHQDTLSSRTGRLDALLERAELNIGMEAPLPVPRPSFAPERHTRATGGIEAIEKITGQTATEASDAALPKTARLRGGFATPALAYDGPAYGEATNEIDQDAVLQALAGSLHEMEEKQIRRVRLLTADAVHVAAAIQDRLSDVGIEQPSAASAENTGGPFIDAAEEIDFMAPADFDASLEDLNDALQNLESVRDYAATMPLAHPANGKIVTSHFGLRSDPFLSRKAFHAGMDFRLRTGERIKAAGAGTVVWAGRRGGYGKLVEIDHGDGYVTRYAHLSRIDVTKGESVSRGQAIGAAGSTGRSTGTHLHYEIRKHGKALDPARFVEAGAALDSLL